MGKDPLAQEAVGKSPTDRGKKREQTASAGGWGAAGPGGLRGSTFYKTTRTLTFAGILKNVSRNGKIDVTRASMAGKP
jgi:hypothetical protein